MAQVYGINTPNVISPLAGIAEMYGMVKGIERQKMLDEYGVEKDARTYALEQQKVNDQRAYQQGMLTDRQGERQENYAANWMRNELARLKMEQDARIANCNGEDANTPQCLQAKAYGLMARNRGDQTQTIDPRLLDEQARAFNNQYQTLDTLSVDGATPMGIDPITKQPIYKLSTGATFRMDANGGLKELMAVRPPQQAPQYQTPFATPAQRQNVQAQPADMIAGAQQPICTTDINGRKVCR